MERKFPIKIMETRYPFWTFNAQAQNDFALYLDHAPGIDTYIVLYKNGKQVPMTEYSRETARVFEYMLEHLAWENIRLKEKLDERV